MPLFFRSRGFGFVTFAQSTCVQDVQNQRPHTVDGKDIETKRATPKSVSLGTCFMNLSKSIFCIYIISALFILHGCKVLYDILGSTHSGGHIVTCI